MAFEGRKLEEKQWNKIDINRQKGKEISYLLEENYLKYGKYYSNEILKSLEIDIDSYISSLIHVTMNRLSRTSNRKCEMVLYDFLHLHYKVVIAIE